MYKSVLPVSTKANIGCFSRVFSSLAKISLKSSLYSSASLYKRRNYPLLFSLFPVLLLSIFANIECFDTYPLWKISITTHIVNTKSSSFLFSEYSKPHEKFITFVGFLLSRYCYCNYILYHKKIIFF